MRKILGEARNIRELLGGAKYAIDYYQREYRWETKQVRELMSGYARDDRTVLLTTHSMEVAEAISDRVMLIDRGRIVAEGSMEELRAHLGLDGASLEAIFLRLIEEEAA